ncbi:MAG: type II toxin-antitoxin system HipA family toxin [Opitutaceae bacterium]|jgi:serine/threonine-protein kinase HipA|nr:type II toxin-antitoxin system HipA family toxin [Opitutaceae bacterium]
MPKTIRETHIKKLLVRLHGKEVGALELADGRPFFTYSREWLATRIELSPRNWPLRPEPYRAVETAVEWGLPGFIADSLPDAFGKEIMLRHFAEKGLLNPTPLDLLAVVGERGMGALTYRPAADDTPLDSPAEAIDAIQLGRLAREAEAVVAHLETGKISPVLLREGSSIGGARPKMRLCIGRDGKFYGSTSPEAEMPGASHWIVKFDAVNSGWGCVELAYSYMARAAGIDAPESRIIRARRDDGVELRNFAIRRFDRVGAERVHYHSAAGYYNRSIQPPNMVQGDYGELLAALGELGAPAKDREEMLRRCIFNVLACVFDDHFKNTGFCMTPEGRWRLSPAFDLCYCDPALQWVRTLGRCSLVNGRSRDIRQADVLALCPAANIPQRKGRQIIGQVAAAVGEWARFSGEADVPTERLEQIRSNLESVKTGFFAR